jgi:hypothetical protein
VAAGRFPTVPVPLETGHGWPTQILSAASAEVERADACYGCRRGAILDRLVGGVYAAWNRSTTTDAYLGAGRTRWLIANTAAFQVKPQIASVPYIFARFQTPAYRPTE